MNSSTKRSFMILLLSAFLPASAWADGNIHVGPIEIHPYVSVRETWSDNIYSNATLEKSDHYTTTTPGLRLFLPFRMHEAGAEYNATVNQYNTYNKENTTDNNTSGYLNFKFGSLIGLKVQDVYAKGHEPRGFSSTGFIEKFITNNAFASVTYGLADLSKIQIDHTKTTWEFQDSIFRDRTEDSSSVYVFYRFLPKTSVFLEYDRKNVNFDQTDVLHNLDDSTVTSTFVGLTWEMTSQSKGTVKAGRLAKDFSDAGVKDFSGSAYSIDVQHQFSEYTSLQLVGQRAVNETNLLGSRYVISSELFGEYRHRLTHKVGGLVRGSYGKALYSDAITPATIARMDRVALKGAGLKYFMREWLEFSLDYNVKSRVSNFSVNDFDEKTYMVSVSMSL